MPKQFVVIKTVETDEVVRRIPCQTYIRACSVERGVNINLNLEEYYTEIEEE